MVQDCALNNVGACEPAATEAIRLIYDHAKVDRNGVFWALGSNYRQANPALYETTLGFGSAGILLVLLEYYRRTQDAEIAEVIHRGLSWLQHRTGKASLQLGFYAGTAGLWYLFKEIDKTFPGTTGSWKERARTLLAEHKPGNHPASVATGLAGTIIGALATLDLDPPEEKSMLGPLLSDLLAAAKPNRNGAFWDFSPTSIRPPVGFADGNAGVDYCLSLVRHRMCVSYTSLLAGSLAHADALFDTRLGNWPDQDSSLRLQQMRPTDLANQTSRKRIKAIIASISAEDSLSWGTGTAGILFSRCWLRSTYDGSSIGEHASNDCQKAIQRLDRASEQQLEGLNASLLHGLGGIALSLSACRSALHEAEASTVEKLLRHIEALLRMRQPSVTGDDLSLLTGIGGHAYAVLKVTGDSAEQNCLAPQPKEFLKCNAEHVQEGDLEPAIKRRLPACAIVPEVQQALATSIYNLQRIETSAFAQVHRDPSSVLTKSIRHELSLYDALSDMRFQELFWEEFGKRARFAQSYGQGPDIDLLMKRFRLDASVTLFELDFDPHARTASPSQRIHCLRQATSTGVAEIKLSPLQHALISGFRESAVTLEVIHYVIRRVETPNVTQRQLADLSRHMIRSFVEAGYLAADDSAWPTAWFKRRRLRATRDVLFPASPC